MSPFTHAAGYICLEVDLVISIQLNASPFQRSWCHDTLVMCMSVYNVYRLLQQSQSYTLPFGFRFSFIKFTFLNEYIQMVVIRANLSAPIVN